MINQCYRDSTTQHTPGSQITMQVPSKTTVRFPNLFAGFLNGNPTINANYVAVKAASERTISQYVYMRKS